MALAYIRRMARASGRGMGAGPSCARLGRARAPVPTRALHTGTGGLLKPGFGLSGELPTGFRPVNLYPSIGWLKNSSHLTRHAILIAFPSSPDKPNLLLDNDLLTVPAASEGQKPSS